MISTAGKRGILRVSVFAGDEPPVTYRFHASNIGIYRVPVAAGETAQPQSLGMEWAANSGIFLALNSTIEGVTFQRAIGGEPHGPLYTLRPFFVSDYLFPTAGVDDAIAGEIIALLFTNPTAYDAVVTVLAARE